MKKIILIALLLTPFLGFSQTTKPIDGFLGIKFGSTKLAVIAALKAKGATIDKTNADPNSIQFNHVKLGHRECSAFWVYFVDNKACEAEYAFDADVEAHVPGYYADIITDINNVYGPGTSSRNFTSPYQEGDGEELLGLSAGKIDFHTLWFDSNRNSIKAKIDTDMSVRLFYQDNILMDQYIAKQKTKESSDY